MPYKLAIFDVDGTLLDTQEGILSSVKYTIENFGLKTPNEADLLKFIGPPIQDSFARTFGLDIDTIQGMTTVFRNKYGNEDLIKAKPYDGIYEVFDTLERNGIKTAVATYKRADYAVKIVEHFGFTRYTRNIHGADNNNIMKKSDIIESCLECAPDIERKSVVMIGDTLSDGLSAQKCGVDFLAVTYGYGFTECDKIECENIGSADDPKAITQYILGK